MVGLANHTVLIARGGAETAIEDSAAPIKDADGNVVGVVMVFQDATERRRHEAALRESEERLRGVFQQSMAGIALTDTTGRFTLANERYCQIVRRPADELYALRMQDITRPDDLSRNLPLFEQAMKDGTTFSIEKRYVRPDGSHVWVSNNVSTLRETTARRSACCASRATSPSGSGPSRSWWTRAGYSSRWPRASPWATCWRR